MSFSAKLGSARLGSLELAHVDTLPAEIGSFTFTGESATLDVGIGASTGSFTLTGESVTFDIGFGASTGFFVLTGESATLDVGLGASTGSFIFTGEPADIVYQPTGSIVVEFGSFTLTGELATFDIELDASFGNFIEIGEDAFFSRSSTFDTGIFTETGQDVSFKRTIIPFGFENDPNNLVGTYAVFATGLGRRFRYIEIEFTHGETKYYREFYNEKDIHIAMNNIRRKPAKRQNVLLEKFEGTLWKK